MSYPGITMIVVKRLLRICCCCCCFSGKNCFDFKQQ